MKIALLGDIAFFGKYSLANAGIRDYFRDVSRYLAGFDHVVGNLETPFGDGDIAPKGPKSAYIKSESRNVELLKYLNVDVVNLANNHIFDYGAKGYESTLDALQRNGIDWFGVGGRQKRLEDADARVALHGYCSYNTNPLGISRDGRDGVDPLNVGAVEAAMRSNREDGFLNVVSVHSGQEHVNYPSVDDIRLARRLARNGAYVYYGHHPHVLQGVESVGGAVLAYSLGNFCFDDVYTSKSDEPLVRQTLNNRQGGALELEVIGREIRSWRMTPLLAGDDCLKVGDEGIEQNLRAYSEALSNPGDDYESRRRELIRAFLEGRRQMRDAKWYLKRLNMNSVGIVLRARYNQRQYRKNVTAYLGTEP